ncbi:MAG: hypothetical protein JNK65_07135 [Deltaproteobacteria bacterium]|nr:hypothetical protein [Deltaproteobacteria bacterium]
MAKKKRKAKSSSPLKEWITPALIVATGAAGLWYWQSASHPKPSPKPKTALSESKQESKKEEKTNLAPSESQKEERAQSIFETFPKQAWSDNYLQVALPSSSGSQKILVALGLAPQGKNADQIRNPDQLSPSLLLLEKNDRGFHRLSEFHFPNSATAQSGLKVSDLKGIPRITSKSFLDLDHDGTLEIVASLDTAGEWTEAIAFLKIENNEIRWMKTRDKSGQEKIALFKVGASPTESAEVTTRKSPGKESYEIIQKQSEVDEFQAAKGVVSKNIVWEMRNGMLQEK